MTKRRRRIRGVLLDLSGTLHVGETPIPGAVESVQRLIDAGIRVRFLTNTSKVSFRQLLSQLHRMGFSSIIQPDTLWTSVMATKHYLQKNSLRPFCLMEDTSDFTTTTTITTTDTTKDDDGIRSASTAASLIPLDPPHNCVVVGLAPSHFHYNRLNQAFDILRKHPKLIAIHRAFYYKAGSSSSSQKDNPPPSQEQEQQELSLGPGGFVTCLEQASGCPPAIVMGKPSREFFHSALWQDENDVQSDDESSSSSSSFSARHVCMVGDDIVQDIEGAQRAGIGTTVLVQTGKYQEGDETKMHEGGEPITPTAVVPSIVQAVDFILNELQNETTTGERWRRRQ